MFIYILQYLGCIEVYESRGMQVCEEAHKTLRQVGRSQGLSQVMID